MKDRSLLVVTAFACAVLAVLFWRAARESGFLLLSLVSYLCLLIDSLGRRNRIQAARQPVETESADGRS